MEDTNMFKIIELHPVANFLLGIVLVELTIAAVSDALNSVPKGRRIKFGFYREDDSKKG